MVDDFVPQNPINPEVMGSLGLALASELPKPSILENAPVLGQLSNVPNDPGTTTSENTPNPLLHIEIPVFEIDLLSYKDPLLLVEGLAAEGKKYGAVKIKMNDAFTSERGCRLNPDSFTFKANRLLNNPPQNELFSRLRFYNELIKFHTRDIRDTRDTSGVSASRSCSPQKENEGLLDKDLVDSTSSPSVLADSDPLKEAATVNIEPSIIHENLANVLGNEDQEGISNIDSPNENDHLLGASKTASQKPKLPVFLTKFPMMDKRPLDLFDLYRFVIRKGGYIEVINRKLWAQVGRELGYKGKITSSLSSSLKVSYAKILYPLELHLQEKGLDLTGDENLAHIRKCNSESDNLVGHPDHSVEADGNLISNGVSEEINTQNNGVSKRTYDPSLQGDLPACTKKRKLNTSAPLILGSAAEFRRSLRIKSSKGFLINEPHLMDLKTPLVISIKDPSPDTESKTKSEVLVCPTGAAAQINNYLKWLASYLSIIQDSSRLEVSSKLATTYSLRQFIEKDSKFQEFLMQMYKNAFARGTRGKTPDDLVNKSDEKVLVSPSDLEAIFWEYLWETPAEYSKLENCSRIPGCLADGSGHYMGDDFASQKSEVYAGLNSLVGGNQSEIPTGSSDQNGIGQQATSHDSIAHAIKVISGTLNPFELSNIPYLPDSLLGAFTALDLANNDLVNPGLNIGMTFSTENWKCEDHFTQLCNYHSFGKSKRWYFIPELEFEKFEELLRETIAKQNNEAPRVNKNYDTSCWDVGSLANFVTTDDEVTSTQYECLFNSLENIVSPYPETRVQNDNPVFQSLIDLKNKKIALNQEYFITPEMLKERGIKFTTTLQSPGEFIYKYPKTYSSTISFGFNVSEEINFASKLWIDYSIEGEKWLQNQGILPNFLAFKLLTNFAQILESSNGSNNHFSPLVHSKVLENYSVLLEEELELRNSVRNKVKIKEVTIEERNMFESDMVTDDDLLSALPSKIVIHSSETNLSFAMSLRNFSDLLNHDGATKIREDFTFSDLLKHPKFHIELHLFYSDEKLKSFQRSLNGFSVDFELWLTKYDELMNSEDEMVLKNYKALLHDGQKIFSALSGAQNTFENFCLEKTLNPETRGHMEKIENFKKQLNNLREFVEESSAVVDQCHAIVSLKHQQRIRNGGADSTDHNEDEHPESLQLLVELANKIPHLNFYTPEFELILEYKTEIQNFDNACRLLIGQGNFSIPEINDMINLGTSFGVEIPSLKFLIRLKGRLQWIETFDIIVSGGDPFSGKKEIFSLPDLRRFRDKGLEVLSNGDVDKLKMIDQYLKEGQEYDDSINVYLSQNKSLNSVDIRDLETRILDMEERSKLKGKDRLFVELSTYQKMVDLRAQEKHITFLRGFSFNTHNLHDIRQLLLELESCTYIYDNSHIKGKVEQCENWLKKTEQILAQVKVFQREIPANASTKNICNTAVVEKAKHIAEKSQAALSNDTMDVFEASSPFLFVHDLQDEYQEQTPMRYCLCRDYEDGTMIECDGCHEWFHVTCVKDMSKIGDDDDRYHCPCCLVLSSYQITSREPGFTEKLKDVTLLGLIKEGEALQVKPFAEISLLKDLWSITEDAQTWFLQPAMRTRLENHGALYQMFLLRKFIGSPILVRSVVMFLLNSLKFTDLNRAFDQKPKPRVEEAADSMAQRNQALETDEKPEDDGTLDELKSEENVQKTESTPEDNTNLFSQELKGSHNDPDQVASQAVQTKVQDDLTVCPAEIPNVSIEGSEDLPESSNITSIQETSPPSVEKQPDLQQKIVEHKPSGDAILVESQAKLQTTAVAPTRDEAKETTPTSEIIDPMLMETQSAKETDPIKGSSEITG